MIVVIVSQVYTYIKTCQTVHFKYVQFNVGQLYLNKGVKRLLKTQLTWFNHQQRLANLLEYDPSNISSTCNAPNSFLNLTTHSDAWSIYNVQEHKFIFSLISPLCFKHLNKCYKTMSTVTAEKNKTTWLYRSQNTQ